MSQPTPYVASLRVFEPLAAFDPADQLRWQAIAVNDNSRDSEQRAALRRAIAPAPTGLTPDGAHILDIDGARYVCPWSTATRCWAALEDFRETLPTSVSIYFLPEEIEDAIAQGSQFLDDRIPHILTETWIVPPRWFSLFIPNERVRGHNDNGAFTVLRTSIAQAKMRCEMAHTAVSSAFGDGPVAAEIEDLADWLDAFHPQSMVELDYGGLATYLESSLVAEGEAGLEGDTSVEDVLSSIAGLASGDGALAGRGYERLVTRWRRVAAFEQAM
jgi:hypothetical protein